MAQLVARFHGMEEVRGSNPLSSTKSVMLEPPAVGRRFLVLSGVAVSCCLLASPSRTAGRLLSSR